MSAFGGMGAIRIIDKYEGRDGVMSIRATFHYFQGMECDMYSFSSYSQTAGLQVNILKNLSCEAKVLYGLMLDRMSLSIKNRWFDERGQGIYFLFGGKRLWKCLTVAGIRL